ncbi:hypothetical protein QFC21_005718 [Naganishia friedmannii]|uniref:Uncharacterized protein n=1 Tax=Naganishia friedmannii TaxID=89922 RepID=A0ACC2V771_9TREE|nr:hypothetical protein QFC21_005718 [Naganishia friedmannii]
MAFAITSFDITYKATVDGVISGTGDDSSMTTTFMDLSLPCCITTSVRPLGETGDVWFGDCDYPGVNFTLAARYGTSIPLILSVSRISHGPGFEHTEDYAPGADLINGWNERLNNIKSNSLFSTQLQGDGNAHQIATLREKMNDLFAHL